MLGPFTVTITPNCGWDERVLVFQLDRLVTSFAVISHRYVVLLDTMANAATARTILDTIRPKLATRQLLVVNTHADWDHCWGNMVFGGSNESYAAPIIAHRLCRERLLSEEARTELATMQQQSPGAFDGVRIEPPTITFDHHLLIEGGDLTFELIHTPGHQPDHIAIFVPELRALFVGDAAEQPIPYVTDPATIPELRASLKRLIALDAQTVFGCHARHTQSPDVLHANLAYFDTLEQWCRAALAANRISEQLAADDELAALVAFPFADVPGSAALDDDEQVAYRDAHATAIRAMLTFVRSHGTS